MSPQLPACARRPPPQACPVLPRLGLQTQELSCLQLVGAPDQMQVCGQWQERPGTSTAVSELWDKGSQDALGASVFQSAG